MSSRTLLVLLLLLIAVTTAGCQAAQARTAILHHAVRGVAAVVIDANTPAAPAAVGQQPSAGSEPRALTCHFRCPLRGAQRTSTLRS